MAASTPSNTGDLSGQKFGQYEIGPQLGQGGMATVYQARQTSIGRTVAIKVMPTYFLGDPSFLQRFEREVKVIADLQHPRVLPVYDYGQMENRPFIVMAYMPGGTIADRIRQGSMPVDEVSRLVEQIAEGLDHAHRKGIIHRDFKPSNVLLDENGNAYLADFGIAKVTESTAQLTGSGLVGTPAYMAPEMAEHGDISPSVDIYALGITLYQMLTGKFPYQGETPIRVMMAHTQDPIPDVREARPDLSEPVAEVVKTAMAKKPNDRFATAGDLASALKKAVRGQAAPSVAPPGKATMVSKPPSPPPPAQYSTPVGSPTPPPPAVPVPELTTPPPQPKPTPPRKRRLPTWMLIVGGLGVIALGVCLCLVILNSGNQVPSTEAPVANLIVENDSGATVCKVFLSIAGSGSDGVEQLGGHQVDSGSTFRLTGIKPGDYDIRAEDCTGNIVANDHGLTLPVGDFTWKIQPPQ